jgi:hypothetical protein
MGCPEGKMRLETPGWRLGKQDGPSGRRKNGNPEEMAARDAENRRIQGK